MDIDVDRNSVKKLIVRAVIPKICKKYLDIGAALRSGARCIGIFGEAGAADRRFLDAIVDALE